MRIVATHDLFRGHESGLPSIAENSRWIHELLRIALVGLPGRLELVQAVGDGGVVDVARIYGRLGLPANASGWARMVSEPALAEVPELVSLMSGDLVVGFGLTPALLRGLDTAGVRVLDVEISPFRFGRKLYFRARTTCPVLARILGHLEVGRDEIAREAQIMAGLHVRSVAPGAADRAIGVVFGQSHLDLSIVERGRIASLEDDGVIEKLSALATEVEELHVVPHPSTSARPSNLHRILAEVPNALLENQQAYAYLLSGGLRFAAALSSSTLHEAAAFGRRACPLIVPDRDCRALLPPALTDWVDVHDGLFAPSTWRAVIEGSDATGPTSLGDRDSRIVGATFGRPAAVPPALRPLPFLDLDQPHPVCPGGRAAEALRSGWSQPESWGTWSLGDYASLAFRFAADRRVRVRIDLQLCVPYPPLAPEIRVRVPGRPGFTPIDLQQSGLDNFFEIEVEPTSTGGLFNLAFQILSPASPAAFGINAEERRLAVGVRSIEIKSGREGEKAVAGRQANAFRSDYYEDLHARSPGYQQNNWLLPYVRPLGHLAPATVVECGCGNGAFVEAIATFAGEVIGLDWAPSPLFPHSMRGVRFHRWNAVADSVPAADLVCSADFLEHIPPDQVQDVLGRILTAAAAQFHVIACYDDFHSHLTIEPPASWLARFDQVVPGFRLLDAPTRSQDRPIAVLTNIPVERLGF
jgi:hypothetical protein